MSKGDNRRIGKTILISGFGVAIGYLINFLVTPFITENLGVEAYSFVSIASTAAGYAGIAAIALTSFMVRYISVSYHKNDIKNANSYYSTSIESCLVLSAIIFLLAICMISRLEFMIRIPEHLVFSVKILFVIVFTNFIINMISTPFSTAAYIKNRLDVSGVIKIVSKLIEVVIMVLAFRLFVPQVWFLALGSLIASTFMLTSNIILTGKLTPELSYSHHLVKRSKIKDLLENGIWNSLNQLGNVLNSGLDLMISNLMLSGTETGQIAIAKTMGTIFSTLFQTASQTFHPLLLRSYSGSTTEGFLKELKKAMIVCGFFGSIAFSGFLILGKEYYQLWLPSQNAAVLHMLTVITIFNYITDSILQPVYYISTLTVKNRIPCFVTIIGGIWNVILMYYLIKFSDLGMYSVVITTAVIMIGINLLFNPIYAARCIDVKPLFFYKILLKHICAVILTSLTFNLVKKIIPVSNWLQLIANAVLMSITGVFIYLLIMCGRKGLRVIFDKITEIFAL